MCCCSSNWKENTVNSFEIVISFIILFLISLLSCYHSHYLKSEALKLKVMQARANVQMYSQGSKKYNEKKKEKEEKKLSVIEDKLAKILKTVEDDTKVDPKEEECVSAFIIFNHEESYQRCTEDYHSSNSTFGRLLQPPPLRFRYFCISTMKPIYNLHAINAEGKFHSKSLAPLTLRIYSGIISFFIVY
jgi:hypothetical protein